MKDKSVLYNRNDTRWSHQGLEEEYYIDGRATVDKLTDENRGREKNIKSRNKTYEALEAAKPSLFEEFPEYAEQGETFDITIPGCSDEPDANVRVMIRVPKKRRKKMPVIFYIAGGAMLYGTPYMGPVEEYCYKYNCVVVAPWYRSSLDAPYPAAMNDFQAAYEWMVENAAEYNINTDKVVLGGLSAGAYFSIAFAFRLKRLGYKPRGCVALDPIFTTDKKFLSNNYTSDNWDSAQMRRVMDLYLGKDADESKADIEAIFDNATVDDCVGLCPIVIHISESDAGRDPAMAFAAKLYEAGVYTEVHQWGGVCHATLNNSSADNEFRQRFMTIVDGNFKDLLKYDMRRQWLTEEE